MILLLHVLAQDGHLQGQHIYDKMLSKMCIIKLIYSNIWYNITNMFIIICAIVHCMHI